MISPAIHDAKVRPFGSRWIVVHPANDAILAYADTEDEAEHYREAINDLPRQLRSVGREVAP